MQTIMTVSVQEHAAAEAASDKQITIQDVERKRCLKELQPVAAL